MVGVSPVTDLMVKCMNGIRIPQQNIPSSKLVANESLPKFRYRWNPGLTSNNVEFACPFYQKNPEKSKKSCASSSWGTIDKLKNHLYNSHPRRQCSKCRLKFENRYDFKEHKVASESCKAASSAPCRPLDRSQENELQRKKVHQNEEKQWMEIYKMLFPSADCPSPFYKSRDKALSRTSLNGGGPISGFETSLGLAGLPQQGNLDREFPGAAVSSSIQSTKRNPVVEHANEATQKISGVEEAKREITSQATEHHHLDNPPSGDLTHNDENGIDTIQQKDNMNSQHDVLKSSVLIPLSETAIASSSNKEIGCENPFLSKISTSRSPTTNIPFIERLTRFWSAVDSIKGHQINGVYEDETSNFEVSDSSSEYWDTPSEISIEEDRVQPVKNWRPTIFQRMPKPPVFTPSESTNSSGFVQRPGEQSGSQNRSSAQPTWPASSSSRTTTQSTRYGQHVDENLESDEDDAEDENNKRRSNSSNRSFWKGESSAFACPFFQRSPMKHQREACTGPGFTIRTLKEHIRRRHKLPQWHCDRCWKEFATKVEHDSHRRLPPNQMCAVNFDNPYEGITAHQLDKLHSRSSFSGKTDEEKWNVIYSILFPDDANIPLSHYQYYPFYREMDIFSPQAHNTQDFEEYLKNEHARLLYKKLEHALNHYLGYVPAVFAEIFSESYKDCFDEVSRTYHQELPQEDLHAQLESLQNEEELPTDWYSNMFSTPTPFIDLGEQPSNQFNHAEGYIS